MVLYRYYYFPRYSYFHPYFMRKHYYSDWLRFYRFRRRLYQRNIHWPYLMNYELNNNVMQKYRVQRYRLVRKRYLVRKPKMFCIKGIGFVSADQIRAALGADYYKKRSKKKKTKKKKSFRRNPFQATYQNDYSTTELSIDESDNIGFEDSN